MAQLKQVCTVTNGSQTVTVVGTNVAYRIKANTIFMVQSELVPYVVAADAVFDGTNTVVRLAANYQGTGNAMAAGVFATDFTLPDNLPLISQGDVGTAAIWTNTMYKIQALMAAVSPTGLVASVQQISDMLNAGQIAGTTTAANAAAALASQNAAKSSETNAKTSETNAAASASAAATSKTNAATSETNAGSSKTAAAASATAASGSASAASSSQGAAASSATSAANSATAAAGSATGASGSATAASGSASAALASQNAAKTSETNSKTSETNAATSATNAAGSATAAAGSASAASTSATNAAGSATTANSALTQVQGILTTMNALYLGQKASDPTKDNNNSALTVGAEYFNTTNKVMRVYTSTGWQDVDQTSETMAANATASASAAAGSATAASNSATAASASQTAAAGSASAAATSATNAGNSATAASTSATNASNSASAASTSAGNAHTSETNAAASAAQAQSVANTIGNPVAKAGDTMTGDLLLDNAKVQSTRYATGGAIVMRTANGTSAAPTAVTSLAQVMVMLGRAYDGANWQDTASIAAYTESAVTSSSAPASLRFSTTPSGSVTTVERMRINGTGRLLIGTTTDDGSSLVQSAGVVASAQGFKPTGRYNPAGLGFPGVLELDTSVSPSVGRLLTGDGTGYGFRIGKRTSAGVVTDYVVVSDTSGHTMFGTTTDDGLNLVQANGGIASRYTASATTAHLSAIGASGALGNEGKIRLHGTFGNLSDTGTRLIASLRAGFNAGQWGKEYLDFYLNSAVNDAASDANQTRVMRMAYGGRVLVGNNQPDDGATTLQVNSSLSVTRLATTGQNVALNAGVTNNVNSYSLPSNASPLILNATTDASNSAVTAGSVGITFQVLGSTKATISQGGRLLIGSVVDDGVNALQVYGSMAANNVIKAPQFNIDSTAATYRTARFYTAGVMRMMFGLDNSAEAGSNAGSNPALWVCDDTGALLNSVFTVNRASQVMSVTKRLLVGTTSDDTSSLLQVAGDLATYGGRLLSNRYGIQAALNLQTSGGTVASPTAISAITNVGAMVARGFDGSVMRDVAAININTDGAVTSTSSPGNIQLCTTPSGAVLATERMRITSAGRVLVGTTTDDGSSGVQMATPAVGYGLAIYRNGTTNQWIGIGAAPNVDATVPVENIIKSHSSASAAKALVLHATTDANDTAPTSGTVAIYFKVLGATRARLMSTGNFLLGTATDDGVNLLQVNGTIAGTNSANSNPGLILNGPNGFAAGIHLNNSTATTGRKWSVYSGAAGNLTIGDETAGAGRVAILGGSGRVLINQAADDGTSFLQVNGQIRGIGSASALLASNGGGTGQTSIQLRRDGATTDQKTWEMLQGSDGSLTLRTVNDAYSNAQNAIQIQRSTSYTLGNMLLMQGGGRVLINTTNDDGSNALQVLGSMRAANYYINSQATGDSGVVGFSNSNGPAIGIYGSGTTNAGALTFKTAGTERARFVSAGRLLINTATDDGSNQLQVNGTVAMSGNQLFMTSPTAGIELGSTTTTGSTYIDFHSSGGARDYDARIIASGGSSTVDGQGKLTVTAAGNLSLLPSAGRVLVGNVTDNGTAVLQTGGDITADNGMLRSTRYGNWGGILLHSAAGTQAAPTVIASSTAVGSLVARGYDGGTYRDVASIGIITDGAVSSTSSSGYMQFTTTAPGSVNGTLRMAIMSSGHIMMGNTLADDGVNQLQVMAPNAVGYALAAYRNLTPQQYIGIGAAPNQTAGRVDNYVDSYSSATNAKQLFLNSTTDASNTAPTAGAVGVALQVLGVSKLIVNQAGRVLINTGADDGTNQLQVAGTVSANTALNVVQPTLRQASINVNNFDGLTIEAFNIGNTVKKPVALVPYGGRTLIGTTTDDGSHLMQVNGSISSNGFYQQYADYGEVRLRASSSSNLNGWRLTSGINGASDGSLTVQHSTDNFASNFTNGAVFTSSGRVLIGTQTDDNANLLQVNGSVSSRFTASATQAHLNATAASGALSGEGKIRLGGTFGSGADTGYRYVASLRAGFNAGQWGTEYLDFYLNNANNDAQSDASMGRVMRMTYGGRVLVGNVTDDGSSLLQVNGTAKAINFLTGQLATPAAATCAGSTTGGSLAAATYYAKIVAVDGLGAMTPAGAESTGVATTGTTSKITWSWTAVAGAASYRIYYGTAAGAENAYYTSTTNSFTMTAASGTAGTPPTTNVTGGANVAGALTVNRTNGEGQLWVGQNDGYFYANAGAAGWYSPTKGNFAFNFAANNLQVTGNNVWHAGNFDPTNYLGVSARAATSSKLLMNGAGDATFNWSGQGGQPSYLLGSNDGVNFYVWNPSNFSVNYSNSSNYANSAGSAGSVGGVSSPATYNAQAATVGTQIELAGVSHPNTSAVDAGSPWVASGIRVGSWAGPSGDCASSIYLRMTYILQR